MKDYDIIKLMRIWNNKRNEKLKRPRIHYKKNLSTIKSDFDNESVVSLHIGILLDVIHQTILLNYIACY